VEQLLWCVDAFGAVVVDAIEIRQAEQMQSRRSHALQRSDVNVNNQRHVR
jgi:hypothetical protein